MMASTTDYIAGFKTVQNFGVVDAFTCNAVGAVGNIMGGLQALTTGGKLGAYSELNESSRKEAFEKMCNAAGRMGANAVVGVRIQTQGFQEGGLEVLCYGTAVYVESQ